MLCCCDEDSSSSFLLNEFLVNIPAAALACFVLISIRICSTPSCPGAHRRAKSVRVRMPTILCV